jgi:AcrR family transcriptional regulator
MATGSRPRTLDPSTRRSEILRAAGEVFAQRGFHNTRISDIAGKAGVAQGTIYRFFDSKEELASGLVMAGLDAMKDLAEGALADAEAAGEAERALDRFIDAAAENYARHRPGLKALHSWTSDPATQRFTAGMTDELHGAIEKLIKAAGRRVWRPDGVQMSRLLLLLLYSLSAEQEQYHAKINHRTVATLIKKLVFAEGR